jgi:tyrosyl-tRNA synthetase
MKNVLEVLRGRGLLADVTSPEFPAHEPLTVYAGFDPTSDSLQAGNFVAIMALAHFQRCGHRVIAVVGGGTGLIGDPSGKQSERTMLTEEQVRVNLEGIRENLGRFLDFEHPTAPAIILNNHDWLKEFSLIGFLRDVGRHFRLAPMLARESVRARMDTADGMSFAEFCYQLLQAYDFLWLHDRHGCRVQLGGSDQWGNITAGTELIRRLRGREAFGVTTPLVCDSAGRKFGKSEGNAIYLDARKTPVFDFYQFFLRTEDADAARFLRIFTFVPEAEIAALEADLQAHPERREAQKRLAAEVTRAVHGEAGLAAALSGSAALYGDAMQGLNADELLRVFAEVPSADLAAADVNGRPVTAVAAAAGLCASRGEARRLIAGGGLYLNHCRVADPEAVVASGDIIEGRLLVLRSGKKRHVLVRVH